MSHENSEPPRKMPSELFWACHLCISQSVVVASYRLLVFHASTSASDARILSRVIICSCCLVTYTVSFHGYLRYKREVDKYKRRMEEGDALSREVRSSLAEAEGRAIQEKVRHVTPHSQAKHFSVRLLDGWSSFILLENRHVAQSHAR